MFKYSGPYLDSKNENFQIEIMRSKDKHILMKTFMNILLVMFPSKNFVKTDINTNLGFIIGKFKFFYFYKPLVKLIYNLQMQNVHLIQN